MSNMECTLGVQTARIIPMETSIVTFQVSMVTTHKLFNIRSASLKEIIPSDTGFSLLSPLKSFRLFIVIIVSVVRILNCDRRGI